MLRRAALVALTTLALSAPARAEDATPALAATLHRQIARCWTVPTDTPANVEMVRVKVSLTESGELDGSPTIDGPVAGDPATKAFAASAVRAVVRCAPFRGLAELAPYATWKTLLITFRRPDM
ncbi:hypothetical protein [Shinella sp.]|uniref:hypothetical protein n=1 Tax=Shinella sp. TaxID=1870904 RepID=UPI0039E533F0